MNGIPDLKHQRYPEKHCVAISSEMKRKLVELKELHHKDVNAWIRELLETALRKQDMLMEDTDA